MAKNKEYFHIKMDYLRIKLNHTIPDLIKDLDKMNQEIYTEIRNLNVFNMKKNSQTIIDFKGDFFIQKKAYNKIILFLNLLNKNNITYYINRIDFKIDTNSAVNPLNELKRGYWIGSSSKSFYQPILINKKNKQSLYSKFSDLNYNIVFYNKKENLKFSKNKKYKNYYEFRYKNQKVLNRLEIRMITKKACLEYLNLLNLKVKEETFIKESKKLLMKLSPKKEMKPSKNFIKYLNQAVLC